MFSKRRNSQKGEAVIPISVPRSLDLPTPIERPNNLTIWNSIRYGFPNPLLFRGEVLRWKLRNLPNLWRGFWRVSLAKILGIPTFYGALWGRTYNRWTGELKADYGLMSMRVVTNSGVAFIVDAFQNIVELETMKFHGYGTGTNAEAAGDSALQTELTTEYNPDGTRPTGTTTEGASDNIYRTVATLTIDSGTPNITEHGVFSASSAGVLLDRTKFTALGLDTSTSLETTYELSLPAGS